MANRSAASIALAQRIYERIHLRGKFRLRSGMVSNEYLDKYLFESDPYCYAKSPKRCSA